MYHISFSRWFILKFHVSFKKKTVYKLFIYLFVLISYLLFIRNIPSKKTCIQSFTKKTCIQSKIVLNANKRRKKKSQLLKYSKNYIIPYHEVHESGTEIKIIAQHFEMLVHQ